MRMDTNDLIEGLVADRAVRVRTVDQWLPVALLIAAPFSIALFMAGLGMRPDIRDAMHNPFFDLKFVVTLSLAIPAIVLALRLSRPDARLDGLGWWLVLPFGVLSAGIAGEAMSNPQRSWIARLVGANALVCVTAIPALALPLLAAALFALRRGATSYPALLGLLAGLMAGGLAATLYAMHCVEDSPLFVATWYTLAIGLAGAAGALIGWRVLRY